MGCRIRGIDERGRISNSFFIFDLINIHNVLRLLLNLNLNILEYIIKNFEIKHNNETIILYFIASIFIIKIIKWIKFILDINLDYFSGKVKFSNAYSSCLDFFKETQQRIHLLILVFVCLICNPIIVPIFCYTYLT